MSGIISDNVGRGSGLVKSAGGGGKVGQVVHTAYNGSQQESSINNTDASTSFLVTITPSAASSSILVFGHIQCTHSSGYGGFGIWFTREISGGATTTVGTATGGTNAQYNYHSQTLNSSTVGAGEGSSGVAPFSFIDSPSTTSATTYRLQMRGVSGTANMRVGGNTSTGQKFITPFTAMEILA